MGDIALFVGRFNGSWLRKDLFRGRRIYLISIQIELVFLLSIAMPVSYLLCFVFTFGAQISNNRENLKCACMPAIYAFHEESNERLKVQMMRSAVALCPFTEIQYYLELMTWDRR